MGLQIHVRAHPDDLVGDLCDLLAYPPDDPFQREVVAVPTRGIERWLTQRISLGLAARGMGDGVCANVDFPSPGRLVDDVLGAVPGLEATLAAWDAAALTRTVVAAIDAHLGEPDLWVLARYIEAPGVDGGLGNDQRLRAARKIAFLFRTYARRRPEMVRSWAAGVDVGPDGEPISDADRWQPAMWRRVRSLVAAPSLPELLPAALEPIQSGSIDPRVPSRLSLYGLTAADPTELDVLEAVAARRDVYLYLLHPSPALWRDGGGAMGVVGRLHPLPLRADDPTSRLTRHPLLRSWARNARELQVMLAGRGHDASLPPEPGASTSSVLERLQHDIRTNSLPRPDATLTEAVVLGRDRSIQVHSCHGARRQVEVMRDAVLHVLAADDTLEPRDVVIMTPDLATFAPLLEAAVPSDVGDPHEGEGERDSGSPDALPDLRVRIADRAPAAVNPLVRFAATVLDLAGSRLEAGAVKDLVGLQVVRQCFGYDAVTVDAITDLIDESNVRWGLDADHRSAWDAGSVSDQTWRRALDRVMAGVFYADDGIGTVGAIAPMGGVEGQEARPAGLLAQIIDRIVAVRELLSVPRSHSEWGRAVAAAVRLLAAPAWGEEWQWGQLERLLEESFPPATGTTPEPEIGPAEARLAIADWSEDRPSPLHFRTGDITVCTLVPMRSVPYRVVCLLGMDDERFPRSSRADGDDLLVDHETVGDPDRGAEDRQLLLDALMAAGDHLIITYSGRDDLTNAEYPPAVPIAELEDSLFEMVGGEGVERLVTHHPLQSFSEDNFVAGRLGVAGPWAFDPMQLDGALAVERRSPGVDPPVVLPEPGDVPSVIQLDDLIRLLEHPAKQYMRVRLGFAIPERGEAGDDTLKADLGPLELWQVKDRLLSGLLDGHDLATLAQRERGWDAVPAGELGRDDLERASRRASDLAEIAREHGSDRERHIQMSGAVTIGDYLVEGSVEVDPQEDRIELVTPSRLRGKQRLRAFARLAFLGTLDPSRPWEALLIGQHSHGDTNRTIRIGPFRGDREQRSRESRQVLATLAHLYVDGLSRPIPMPCETAYCWQRKLGSGRGEAWKAAADAWSPKWGAGEADDAANVLIHGDLSIDTLVESGFPEYAEHLWKPILPLLRESPT